MIRLIATDLDDTLLNASSDLTDRTRRALDAAMRAGTMISLSSGRMGEAMVPFAQRIGINAPMILYNGALIWDHRTDETIYTHALERELARQVARTVEDMGIYIQAYPGRDFFCDRKTEYTLAYEKQIRYRAREVGMPISEWISTDMVKLLAVGEPETLDRALPQLRERFPKGVCFMKSKRNLMEIVAEGVDKGVALLRLGSHFGIAADEIMAFGDGQNDVAMLAAAGTGVAVENAVDECKAVAKRIAPKNTADGVAQVIEEYLEKQLLGGV